jgi:hypothetical protein
MSAREKFVSIAPVYAGNCRKFLHTRPTGRYQSMAHCTKSLTHMADFAAGTQFA